MDYSIDKFNELLNKDNKEEITNFFLNKCYNATINEIQYMINSGFDFSEHYDIAIWNSCYCNTVDIVRYFIEECGVDVTKIYNRALREAILHPNYGVIKYLLSEFDLEIDDNVIERIVGVCQKSNVKKMNLIKLFIDRGVSIERIGKIFWQHYKKDYNFIISDICVLEKFGLDLNQSIKNFATENNIVYFLNNTISIISTKY